MSNLGMGVMIGQLGGNEETVNSYQSSMGKTITALSLNEKDDSLHFGFSDGSSLRIVDDGQSCCESRYMRTDDVLADYIGGTLDKIELREAPNVVDPDSEEHEVQFLAVQTSKGQFVMSSHNEHNGYYGGFRIILRYKEAA